MIPLVLQHFPMPPGLTKQMFEDARLGPDVHPLAQDVIGDVGRVLWLLLGTVGIVLLIACANVANLFLVRAEGRQQELAIHAALGAGSRRIAWELLSESLLLSLLGGAMGLLLAYSAIRGLVLMAPDGLPRVQDIGIDPVVLLFTLAVSLFSGLLFGVIPVFRFATPRLASALNQGGRLGTASRQRHRARNALVVAEIALAVVLLVASGLMIRTFQALRHVSPGFTSPSQVLTIRISVPDSLIKDPEIGIRIALGALTRDVTRLFLRQGLLLACAGIVIGMVAAGAATRVMSTLLYGVGALDPLTYVVVAIGLGSTALVASYVPAARAARVDPAEALRREV